MAHRYWSDIVFSHSMRGWDVDDGGAILAVFDDGQTRTAQSGGTGDFPPAVALFGDGDRGWLTRRASNEELDDRFAEPRLVVLIASIIANRIG